ncbi:MAG: hypothetical protein ACR2NU_10630 [Aeoliella sp.]
MQDLLKNIPPNSKLSGRPMKNMIAVIVLALTSAIATAVAIGSGSGSGDTQEFAAGVAVFAGLLAIVTPLLSLNQNKN